PRWSGWNRGRSRAAGSRCGCCKAWRSVGFPGFPLGNLEHQVDERTDTQRMRYQPDTADELVLVPPGSVEVTSRHGALAATLAGMEPGTPISAQYAQAALGLGAGQLAEQPAADGHRHAEGQPLPSACGGGEARQ